jgi:nicotinamidase-related amidase
MQHAFGLSIPQRLEEVCDQSRLALLVYDMQVGVLRQLPSPAELIERVREVLDAAREGGYRVVFTRHMSLPNELAGVAQLRTAMAWQRLDDVRDVRPWFLRDSPGFELIPEVTPRASEAIFDKISLSGFVGTPLEMALRDCGITALAIVGVAMEVGLEPTVRHAADLGFIPVVVTDACGGRDLEARERSLAGLAFAGDAMFTDARTLGPLLRGVRRETAVTS